MVASRIASVERLTCDRIFRHLATYVDRIFTGRLEINCPTAGLSWSIYLSLGRIVWATGGDHPRRRWYRQICTVTGKKPRIPAPDGQPEPCWDYQELSRLSQEVLTGGQVRTVIHGTLAEVLFDLVQAFEQPLLARVNGYGCLLDISVLAGLGDSLCPTPYLGDVPDLERFPPHWSPTLESLRRQVRANWERWVRWGLAHHSPNLAPTICDTACLQRDASPAAYRNLCKLLDGNRTLRDISLRFKGTHKDPYKAARGLAPHIRKGTIALDSVGDLPGSPTAERPLVVCVDRDRDACDRLQRLADEAGYQVVEIPHSFEALYQLERWEGAMPAILFVAADLLPRSGAEFCALLQRLPDFQSVPLVFHGREPLAPERRQQLLQAGAAELLFGEAFGARELCRILREYRTANLAHGLLPDANEQVANSYDETVALSQPGHR